MTSGRLVASRALRNVEARQLKTGVPAVLHLFVGVANCTVGAGSYDKLFKAYMQFENSPDGRIFRNWDRSANYRVSRTAPQFDRAADVLR